MEHNAVARPLNVLAARGVEVVLVDAGRRRASSTPTRSRRWCAQAPTRAVVCQHAGNVTGTIQPVADLADIAHAHGALMLVDGAQAGGHLPVDLAALGADAWACSGHKGLLGPQGVGVLYLAPDCEPDELVAGGTGAGQSEEPLQPRVRPDRYEAGTPNTPGILGLGRRGRMARRARRGAARARSAAWPRGCTRACSSIGGFRVLGPEPDEPRVPVVAVVHERVDGRPDRVRARPPLRHRRARRAALRAVGARGARDARDGRAALRHRLRQHRRATSTPRSARSREIVRRAA